MEPHRDLASERILALNLVSQLDPGKVVGQVPSRRLSNILCHPAVSQQSATAGEITTSVVRAAERVQQITSEINNISDKAEGSSKSAEESAKAVNDINEAITELFSASMDAAKNTAEVEQLLESIRGMSKGNSKEIEQVITNLTQLSGSSSRLLGTAEQIDSLGNGLNAFTDKLDEILSRFKK